MVVIAPPIVEPTPIIPGAPMPSPDVPRTGSIVPYVVHGAEAAWSDVSSWVSDRWHNVTNIFGSAASITWTEIANVVDAAISAEQTAWASFVNTLESWINASVLNLTDAIVATTDYARAEVFDLFGWTAGAIDQVLDFLYGALVAIDGRFAAQWWDTVQAIDGAVAGVEAWAIDNIYHPLLNDLTRDVTWLQGVVYGGFVDLQRQIDGIKLGDIPAILAKLGVITAAITAVETWVEDCGAPMCEQVGPKTDFAKLLKLWNVAGMLALFTAIGSLTEDQLESLAATVASIGADPAAAFADLFVTEGDTLAEAIANTLPSIAF